MVASSSGKCELPWIPAAKVILSACPPESRLRAHRPFVHSYLYNTSCREQTTAVSLAASQWSMWVASLPEQLSPRAPHHPHKLPFVLICKPHPILLLVPVHSTHPRNPLHKYVSDHFSTLWHPGLKATSQAAGNQQAKDTTLPQKHLPTFRPMPCCRSQPWLIRGQVTL